ncbi:hypothetical protein KI387_022987 [Taxus chinensis]|uniref:GTD-binding domain-containing protein n=1 Tax=Taxus chinensis TaxID=29808 RepID=A0AA38LAC3_TAXCH|nr:hypothetical protein KI387_022987 [Taxus chinensis]
MKINRMDLHLMNGIHIVKNMDGTLRCPFCRGKKKQDYRYKDLLQHASGVGAGKREAETTGCHRALEKFLKTQLATSAEPQKLRTVHLEQEAPRRPNDEEQIVWPWMGIIVNIHRVYKDGKYIGPGNGELKERFAGFNPTQVCAMWTYEGHQGKAVLEFNKDWQGYNDALSFERSFIKNRRSRKEYYERERVPGNDLYGWVARAEDYNCGGPVGKHLRSKGDLKTVAQINNEDLRKKNKLGKLRKVEQEVQTLLNKRNEERLKLSKELERQMNEMEERRKELEQREAQNDIEKKKLDEEKKRVYNRKENLQRANELQRTQEEKQRMLIEKHEKQKRDLSIELHQQTKKLADRQKLELEIERLEASIETMKQVKDGSSLGHFKKIEELQNDLKDRNDEMESLQDMNQQLMNKERVANDELQDARKAVIEILVQNGTAANSEVVVKRMGELVDKPWIETCRRKFNKDEWELKCSELFSLWTDHVRDPNWYPFKIVEKSGGHEIIINESDEKLRGLRSDMGEEVYNSVVEALKEIVEYNGSGRYPIPELWHTKEKRPATLKEAVLYLSRNAKRRKFIAVSAILEVFTFRLLVRIGNPFVDFDTSSLQYLQYYSKEDLWNDPVVHGLSEALRVQHHALLDVYSELEAERSASTSLIDDALLMISHLQVEKARLAMEAAQFKREAQEKIRHAQAMVSFYEEVIVRKDEEVKALLCEIEAFKHRFLSYCIHDELGFGSISTFEICYKFVHIHL